jgi:predicted ArsR family transcriptional regulator
MGPARNDRLLDAAERHRLLSDPTRLAVLDALRTGERTIPELVEVTRMHRNTVRNHVVRLGAAGLIEASPGEPGRRGRPAHRYRLRDPMETGDGPVFVEGLVALLRRSHGEEAAGLAESEGERIGERLCGDASPSTPAQVAHQVARMLARLSFEPTVHRRGGRYRIDLHHCPFWGRAVDRDGDVICAFHRGLIRGAMHNASVHPVAMRLLPLVELDLCRTEIEFPAT